MGSGMTDPDTIAALGKQLGATYVLAGTITKLGNQNLLVVAILHTESLQQIAGDIQTYNTITDIEGKLPAISQNIAAAVGMDTSLLSRLALPPLQLLDGADSSEADVLAQILAVHLIQSGKYAVYPRTKSLEQVLDEYKYEFSGHTADVYLPNIGKATNPRLVLSVTARVWGSGNKFNAAVINLETGVQVAGDTVNYQSLNDGMDAMEDLALKLTDMEKATIVKAARKKQAAAEETARKKQAAAAEAERKRQEAVEAARKKQEATAEAARKRQEAVEETARKKAATVAEAERKRQAAEAETERKQAEAKQKWESLSKEHYPLSYCSVSLNVGSTFTTPGLTISPAITIPVVAVGYFDLGCDFGFISSADYIKDLSYNSYYPYIRASAFIPFDDDDYYLASKFGFHIGLGYGCMIAVYKFGDYDSHVVVSAFDVAAGFLFINAIDLSYSVRVSAKSVNHKLSIGLVYRFGKE
ncbi:MAG: hypothetical protein LBL06_01225 [Treponema sp.]|jgi:hypothetical protein|nr:hypothetical protein [Treponema sp.]